MTRRLLVAIAGSLLVSPLYAALKPGADAPDFTTQATLAGKPFSFAEITVNPWRSNGNDQKRWKVL